MSERSIALNPRRQQMRQRFDQLSRSRQQALLRWPEILVLGTSGLMLLAVAFAYFYYLMPAQERLVTLQSERAELQRRLRESEAGAKRSSDTEATVVEIRESLRSFEGERLLLQRGSGRTALIQELNELIARNNLRQVSSIAFTALDPFNATTAGNTVRVQQRDREVNVYPGLGINLTVEGAYANLRRFIHDVETSKQFITIKTVQLQGADGQQRSSQRAVVEPGADSAETPNAGPVYVSLRLEMAAYFQRELAPSSER
ncbi:MAG: hypothetical protein WKF84_17320 [Pyrinomonadaceae bacterium]